MDTRLLYIIECGGAYKIGVATDPAQRIATHQVGSPGRIVPIACMTVGTGPATQAETWFHSLFYRWRLHGEWFKVTRAQIDAAITLALAQFDGALVEMPKPKAGRFVDWEPTKRRHETEPAPEEDAPITDAARAAYAALQI